MHAFISNGRHAGHDFPEEVIVSYLSEYTQLRRGRCQESKFQISLTGVDARGSRTLLGKPAAQMGVPGTCVLLLCALEGGRRCLKPSGSATCMEDLCWILAYWVWSGPTLAIMNMGRSVCLSLAFQINK